MDDGSNLVAWLALAVSVGTFLWKAVETYVRWPRLAVIMRQTVIVGTAPSKLHIVVVNNGAEAATIAVVGVRANPSGPNYQIDYLREHVGTVDGPDLPARVEAHGAVVWTISYELLRRVPEGKELIAYAWRYRIARSKPWPKRLRGPYRKYEAGVTRVKASD